MRFGLKFIMKLLYLGYIGKNMILLVLFGLRLFLIWYVLKENMFI